MAIFTIRFTKAIASDKVEANYFAIEGDFIIFKGGKHEVVAAYPSRRVERVRREVDESENLSDMIKVDYARAKFIISAPTEISFEAIERVLKVGT